MKRVVHVVNQFFAGIGGEDKADVGVGVLDTLSGPSLGLKRILGDRVELPPTLYFGDNYFHEEPEDARAALLREITALAPTVVLLGPAFNSGRYGLACVEIGRIVTTELGINAITAMHPDNPAVETYQSYQDPRLFLLPTTETVAGMNEALRDLGRLTLKILDGQEVGSASDEGYISRGIRRRQRIGRTGAERAIAMLQQKLAKEPVTTEIPMQIWDRVTPAQPVKNLPRAKIALITTSGVVPWGNPDKFKTFRNTFWRKYAIGELETMEPGVWEAVHGGYNVANMNANPLYGVPLDALRKLQIQGEFAGLYPAYYVIPGNQGSPAEMKRMGQEIAAELKASQVDGVLLVST